MHKKTMYFKIEKYQYTLNRAGTIIELTYFSSSWILPRSSDLSRLFSSTCQKQHIASLLYDRKETTVGLESEPPIATVWKVMFLLKNIS